MRWGLTVGGLAGELAAAQSDSARLGEQLAGLESKLTAAVAGQEFTTAEAIKAEIPPVREAWALAEARSRALSQVIAELAEQENARRAVEEADQRRVAARAEVDVAMRAEQEALADLTRNWADVAPGLAAVRESMRAAVAAEGDVWQARNRAHQAMIVLGEREPNTSAARPNTATARIESDRLMYAIFHERQL